MKSYCIIGLGNFGETLAITLAKNKKNQVLVIDENQMTIDEISEFVDHAVCCDPANEAMLRSAGVANYDCCVVCLNDKLHDNTLLTLILKEMGVKKIVARAASNLHKKVLLKVGADMVVFPEQDMGRKLAMTLTKTDMFEYINLSEDISIAEIKAPKRWVGSSVRELNIRQKYGINLIAVKNEQNKEFTLFIDPNKEIDQNELLVIIGTNENIDKLTR